MMDKEELKEAVLKRIWQELVFGLKIDELAVSSYIHKAYGFDKEIERMRLELSKEGYIEWDGDSGCYLITDKLKNRYEIAKKKGR